MQFLGPGKEELNKLTYKIIGACIEVYKHLGPGLLESVYHKCLVKEFTIQNLNFVSEHLVDVEYKNVLIDTKLKCDFLIENSIVLEIKSVDKLIPVFDAQLLTYMKLLEVPKGILVNFNVTNIFKEGQKTMVNEIYRLLPE